MWLCCCGDECDYSDSFGTLPVATAGGWIIWDGSSVPGDYPEFELSAGRLKCIGQTVPYSAYDEGAFDRDFTVPATPYTIEVSADCYEVNNNYTIGLPASSLNSTVGVRIGGLIQFHANPRSGGYRYQGCGRSTTSRAFHSVAASAEFGTWDHLPHNLKIVAVISGTGATDADISLYNDDVLVQTINDQSTGFLGSSLRIGLQCTDGGMWDNLCINVY